MEDGKTIDEIDREAAYEEAIEKLSVSEDAKWLMKYIRENNKFGHRANS